MNEDSIDRIPLGASSARWRIAMAERIDGAVVFIIDDPVTDDSLLFEIREDLWDRCWRDGWIRETTSPLWRGIVEAVGPPSEPPLKDTESLEPVSANTWNRLSSTVRRWATRTTLYVTAVTGQARRRRTR